MFLRKGYVSSATIELTMRTILLSVLLLILFSQDAAGRKTVTPLTDQVTVLRDSLESTVNEVDALTLKIQSLESRISQLERIGDNYRIEKDLLKETFSSNYLYLTFLIAIVGGVFSLLTYLGYKDAKTTKSDFQRELVGLRAQHAKAKSSAEDFEKRRLRYEEEHVALLKKADVQDRRIELVELLEKAHSHLHGNGNAQLALDYATRALELAPERTDVLRLMASCLNRLNRSEEALVYLEKAYKLAPEDTIGDLLECYAFLNRFQGIETLVLKHKATLDRVSRLGGGHIFLAFKYYHEKNQNALIELVDRMINSPTNRNKAGRKFNWSSVEAIQVASYLPYSALQHLLLSFFGWCEGQVSGDDLNEQIRAIPPAVAS